MYATDRAGVTVAVDDGTRPTSRPVLVRVLTVNGFSTSVSPVLAKIQDGSVVTGNGTMTWEEYWKRPGRDYGCNT
ncbi:MAG: hypothetical protein FWC46_03655 [Actinomycetia bacterium]|nr:hypothetical protein [Actinomycetes bacterium]